MHLSPRTQMLLRLGTGVTLAFIYLPIAVIALYAFNSSRSQAWPVDGLTLEWFDKAVNNPGVREALETSLKAAVGATAIAVVLARSPRWRWRAIGSSAATPSHSS